MQNYSHKTQDPPTVTLAKEHPSSLAKTFLELCCHLRLPSPAVSPAPWSEVPHPLLFILTHLGIYFLVDLNNTPGILEGCLFPDLLPGGCHILGHPPEEVN